MQADYGETTFVKKMTLSGPPTAIIDPCHAPRLTELGVAERRLSWKSSGATIWRCEGQRCLPATTDRDALMYLQIMRGHSAGPDAECTYTMHFPFALLLTPEDTEICPVPIGRPRRIGQVGVDAGIIAVLDRTGLDACLTADPDPVLDQIGDATFANGQRGAAILDGHGDVSTTLHGYGFYSVWRYANMILIDLGNAQAVR